ncbi:MAG: ammonium transporter [Jiangellaceae bacterium]
MDTGDTAWVLTSTALVMLMTPGLALFYGGMVRAKSVINMMMMSFGALALISVLWVLYGYSMAFGDDVGGGLLGDPFEFLGLSNIGADDLSGTIPTLLFVGFQGMFAVITVALVSGAIADRAKFWTWMLFAGVWATLVYFPVAHWVFAFDGDDYTGGWIANQLQAIDFAGGTAVHINAGAAGLALALVLGPRIGFAKGAYKPHNLPLVMLGAGLLWFGWFGFNAGSALGANGLAATALVNTIAATGAAILAWLAVERLRDGHATSLGAASGTVAGLVAITPACAALNPLGSLALGAVAGAVCSLAVSLKFRLKYDDSLDVVAVHLIGGIVGTVSIGFLAVEGGLFFGGGVDLLWRQIIGSAAVLAYSLVVTYAIAYTLQKTIGFRVDDDDEVVGVDRIHHGESGYEIGTEDIPEHVLARATAPKVKSEGSVDELGLRAAQGEVSPAT